MGHNHERQKGKDLPSSTRVDNRREARSTGEGKGRLQDERANSHAL